MDRRPPPPYHLSVEKVVRVPGRAIKGNVMTMADSDYGGGILPHILHSRLDPPTPEDREPVEHPYRYFGPMFERGFSR